MHMHSSIREQNYAQRKLAGSSGAAKFATLINFGKSVFKIGSGSPSWSVNIERNCSGARKQQLPAPIGNGVGVGKASRRGFAN